MPYTMRYGSPYEVPAAGAALAQGAEDQTSFARVMQNNKIKLQEREQELQQAQLNLQRSRLELREQKEMRMQRSARREAELRREKLKLQRKESERAARMRRRENERQTELQRRRQERLERALDLRVEQSNLKNKRAAREEINQLRAQGAVPADSSMERPPNSYTYTDPTGQKWRVPRVNPETQQEFREMRREEINKLRKWGAQPIEDPSQASQNAMVYTDAQGRNWQIPAQRKSGFTDEMAEVKRKEFLKRAEFAEQQQRMTQRKREDLTKQLEEINTEINESNLNRPAHELPDQLQNKKERLVSDRAEIKAKLAEQDPEPYKRRKAENLVQYSMLHPNISVRELDRLRRTYGVDKSYMREAFKESGLDVPENWKDGKQDRGEDGGGETQETPQVEEQSVDDWMKQF